MEYREQQVADTREPSAWSSSRACIAYIAGRIISGSMSSIIEDHDRSRRILIAGTICTDGVELRDYTRGCLVSGRLTGIHDHGTGARISLRIYGAIFSGYDEVTGHSFSGNVEGATILVFDHEDQQVYSYTL